jgi:pimeloyl-ACP methyl ester carboxylesterase
MRLLSSVAHKRLPTAHTERPLQSKKFRASCGVEVEYLFLDRGKDQTVVFVNGLLTQLSMWSFQMKNFDLFNLLFFNNRGHGKSSIGESSSASYLHDCANDAAELLAFHRVKRPHVVGFSMGAAIVVELNTILNGELNTVTLVSPVVTNPLETFPFPNLLQKALPLIKEAFESRGFLSVAHVFLNLLKLDTTIFPLWVYFRQLSESRMDYDDFVEYIRNAINVNARTSLTALESMIINGHAIKDGLARLSCPVLVIRGVRDFIINDNSLDIIKKAIPHAQIERLNGATHYPHAEKPDEFNHLLWRFLNSNRC